MLKRMVITEGIPLNKALVVIPPMNPTEASRIRRKRYAPSSGFEDRKIITSNPADKARSRVATHLIIPLSIFIYPHPL
jgi:hypothetical protein